ncbi:hypothetical protein BH09ACT8_BH09ACT8_05830 [soil metagenome]
MEVLPSAVDLSSTTEVTISAEMGASASAASAALLGVTPMGLDADSAEFAAALSAAGAQYLGMTAEHVGSRLGLASDQAISSLTYQATDAINAIGGLSF